MKNITKIFGYLFLSISMTFIVSATTDIRQQEISESMLRSLVNIAEVKFEKVIVGNFEYWRVMRGNECRGYIFSSAILREEIRGYAGPMQLLIYTNANGTLVDFIITKTKDTPGYLNKVLNGKARYVGKNIFKNDYGKIDAVAGATYSSNCIAMILKKAGSAFAEVISCQNNSKVYVNELENPAPPPREIRKVDAKSYNKMIERGTLSNHPAKYVAAQP